MSRGRWPGAEPGVCGCAARVWKTPAPGDTGVECATCSTVIPWEWFAENPKVGNRIIAVQRERDPGGFRTFLVGVVLALVEWRESKTEARPLERRQPSPEEWVHAECLVDEVFGTGVFDRRNPGTQ